MVGLAVTDGGQDINIVTVYVPQKNKCMEREKVEVVIKDGVVILCDFNCKEVMWEEFEVRNSVE